MRDMIRPLALGAILAAAAATGAAAQTYYGNGGYGPYYGNGSGGSYSDGPGYYGRHGRYFGTNEYGPGAVQPSYAAPEGYSANNYGYGTSEQRGWGSGGGAAYDRGYNGGYWGR
jgi:hypothetical protein